MILYTFVEVTIRILFLAIKGMKILVSVSWVVEKTQMAVVNHTTPCMFLNKYDMTFYQDGQCKRHGCDYGKCYGSFGPIRLGRGTGSSGGAGAGGRTTRRTTATTGAEWLVVTVHSFALCMILLLSINNLLL